MRGRRDRAQGLHGALTPVPRRGRRLRARGDLDQDIGRLRAAAEADVTSLKPYHKGDFEARLTLPVPSGSWPEQVVFVIGVAQAIGRGWTLCGDIDRDVDLATDKLRFQGLTFANLTFERP